VFSVTAPIETSLDAKFCTEKCPDAGRNIEASFRGGLPAVTGSITLNIGKFNKNWKVFNIPVYEYANRYYKQLNNFIFELRHTLIEIPYNFVVCNYACMHAYMAGHFLDMHAVIVFQNMVWKLR
jgi:hypothetical protein